MRSFRIVAHLINGEKIESSWTTEEEIIDEGGTFDEVLKQTETLISSIGQEIRNFQFNQVNADNLKIRVFMQADRIDYIELQCIK